MARGLVWLDRPGSRLLRILPNGFKSAVARGTLTLAAPLLPHSIDIEELNLRLPPDLRRKYLPFEHQPAIARQIRERLGSGSTAVDVGACFGYFTVLMARQVGPEGTVYALEPAASNLDYLRRNLEANHISNVQLIAAAAGSAVGQRGFHLQESSSKHGFFGHSTAVQTVTVDVVRLDQTVQEPVDLVLIDVEGAELEVLEGMSGLLDLDRPLTVLLEWNPYLLATAGYEPGEVPKWLRERGCAVSLLDQGTGAPSTIEEVLELFQSKALPESRYTTLLATRTH